jgi:hypothetical protein
MPKKKKARLAPLKGNVTPTNKVKSAIQPVYGVAFTPGKAPSNRKPTHK